MEKMEILDNESAKREERMPQKMSGIMQLVLKSGVVRNEKQANYVLLGLAVTFLIISVFIIIVGLFPKKQKIIRYEDLSPEIRSQLSKEVFEAFNRNK